MRIVFTLLFLFALRDDVEQVKEHDFHRCKYKQKLFVVAVLILAVLVFAFVRLSAIVILVLVCILHALLQSCRY